LNNYSYLLYTIYIILLLIICLALIGTGLASSSKNVQFPPNISKCPDDYLFSTDTEECYNDNLNDADNDCNNVDFKESIYDIPGIGPKSGVCAKKLWAKNCKVDWDGLTNNSIICHSTNL
jgi:hypothetical protein